MAVDCFTLMTTRDNNLLALRPNIPAAQPNQTAKPIEAFQNATLRPLLKWQNDLLVAAFVQYIKKRKNIFQSLDAPKKRAYINQALQKDQRFREWLFGLLAGHFTMEEWHFYNENESEIRKRITSMLIHRLIDQMT